MTAVPRPEDFPELSPAQWAAVEERVRAFEAAWTRGERPRVADFLPSPDPSGGQLLVELAHSDLEFRLRAGEAARVEEYLAAFPELAARPLVVAGLIGTEYRVRRRREPGLAADEYARRFPGVETGLDDEDPGPTDGPVGFGDDDAPADLPRVPGYELIEPLGRGGMGVVYKAVDVRLNRTVAVKTVRPGAGAEERERLRREAEAAAALHHPNVAQVFQVFEHAGRLFVVTEHLSGGSLAGLAGEPVPARRAAALLGPVARGVAYAHSQGIVHRDLKPSNVLLSADRVPKVADFGMAKRLGDDSDLTRTGLVAGSPAYMAPEQAAGPRGVGPAADVYSLGVILYELLVGRPPHRGADVVETLHLARTAEPVPPRRLVPAVPRDLETVCLKCLEKDPARRYPDAGALADDLERFVRGEPVTARPVGRAGRALRWAGRNRGLATLWALLAAAVAGGTGTSLALAAHATASAGRARASEATARRLLFAADMEAAAEATRDGDPARAAELLAAHEAEPGTALAFVRNHLVRHIRPPHTEIDRLGGPAYFVYGSADGRLLAAAGADGRIRIYEGGTYRRIARWAAGQGEVNGLAFSLDGRRIASAGDDGTVVL